MARRKNRQNIDDVLRAWPHEPGELAARIVKGDDGRPVLQMRLDMGVLQMETTGRPDGARPAGAETFYDVLAEQAFRESEFTLSDEQCNEVDREFVQYYHRRTCWLALREFRRAVEDADHTLALMDISRKHSEDQEWTLSHEQYRPFVLFHRTQAAALAELEDNGANSAIDEINKGLDDVRKVFVEYDAEDHFEDDDLVQKLRELRESVREHYEVGPTLDEQLSEAVAQEDYEQAAKLRDQLMAERKAES
ncbi:MAG: UvrB/UvrC motif-containing protein [Pirellulales bacterium]